ncbi:MAG: 2-oxoacid:ferredoxin oxidoreductase subunit beta [Thermoanaerobaculia bacterium]
MSETIGIGGPSKLTRKDFISDQDIRWCPGCGDYAILAQMQKVMPELGVPREKVVFVSGIGCSSRFPYYMNTYGFHTIHGRAPAVATGIKVTRPELMVWVITGDGDGLSIGGNHLIHAMRRNVDLKILLFNNRIYGLTKGQYSPTSEQGKKTKSTPLGSVDRPFNPLSVAIGAEATFVARSIDIDSTHLQQVLRRAAEHKGTAFVEIYQNCNVFNDGAWESVTDKASKSDRLLVLEHGKPLIFGKERKRGIRMRPDMSPEVIEIDGDTSGLLIHDETRPQEGYHFMLSRLTAPEFPQPVGVLRAVREPTYDELVTEQGRVAVEQRGDGDLVKLLHSGETWVVS